MTIESFTGVINTDGEWETVESLTNITFTIGNTYNCFVDKNDCHIKIGDYVRPIRIQGDVVDFNYKAGSEDLYIKTGKNDIVFGILEGESAS